MANPSDTLRQGIRYLERRPQLAIAGGAAIAVGAVILARQSYDSSGTALEDAAATDPADTDTGTLDESQLYDPNSPFSGSGPYGAPYPGDPPPPPERTPDGCVLPKPTVPAAYRATHRYTCNAGAWVLLPIPPGRSPEGCPLPMPRLDPRLEAAGWSIVCDDKANVWRYRRSGDGGKPKPKPHVGPHVAVSAGPHRLFDVNRGKHGQGTEHALAGGSGSIAPKRAVVWDVAGAPRAVALVKHNGEPVGSVRMVQLTDRDAAGGRGKWLELGAGVTYSSGRA